MPAITVKIDKGGKINVGGKGFDGSQCIEATKKIEKILGAPIEGSRKPTEEMFTEETDQNLHVGGTPEE